MLKYLIFSLISLIVLLGCEKNENPILNTCSEFTHHPEWKQINFKSDLTIQVPTDYMGGISGFEGPTFTAFNDDISVIIEYFFCGPLRCMEYGDTLTNSGLDTLSIYDRFYFDVTLPNRVDFCDGPNILGVFYYGEMDPVIGKLYWKIEDFYFQSATAYYDPVDQMEIERIFQTIREK